MKLLVVDDNPLSVVSLITETRRRNWHDTNFAVPRTAVAGPATLRNFLKEVSVTRPDVVVLDAALTDREALYLDERKFAKGTITEDKLSGFKYCRALAAEKLGIPIVFFTQSANGEVARIAMRAGANRVLVKDTEAQDLANQIEELVKRSTPHDAAFYWPARESMDPNGPHANSLRRALDRFFLSRSSVRRFGLFTASLREILGPLFQGDLEAERNLMLRLMRSQVLLSLVDPKLRDHVKHTGNVFWVGYSLVNELRELQSLPGESSMEPDASLSGDELLQAWTLAALYHDYGYVDERQGQLIGLVKGLLPHAAATPADVRNEKNWDKSRQELKEFVQKLCGHNHFLHRYLDETSTRFGNECETTKGKRATFIDHGLLGAHRLLESLPLDRLDKNKKNVVMHAAVAIAFHNYAAIAKKWTFGRAVEGKLLLGEFPVCSLLALCDAIQTWDREPETDPVAASTESYDGLLARLVLSDTAYVSDSEITEFQVKGDGSGTYDLFVRLRYFLAGVSDSEKVCETLEQDIQSWIDSGQLRDICIATGFSGKLRGRIVYDLPMLWGCRDVIF